MKRIYTFPIKLALSCLLFVFVSSVYAQPEPEIEVSWNGTELVSGAGEFDVGDVMIGVPASNWFTIKNIGSADLTLGASDAVTIGGADPGEFLLESDASGAVIVPGALNGFLLTFNPTTPGPKSIIVSIESDDGDENTSTFTVTGTAVDTAPECEIPTPGFETYYTGSFSNGGLFGAPMGPTGTVAFEAPSGWLPGFSSLIGALFGGDDINIGVTSDARTGDVAFELFSNGGVSGSADALGLIVCGEQPDVFKGYYKFNCAPTDEATISVSTVSDLGLRGPTNTSALTIDSDAPEYTVFQLPIHYDELSDGNIVILFTLTNNGISSFILDDLELVSTALTVEISSSETGPTNLDPIPINIKFSEPVTGFGLGGIVVGNGSASDLIETGEVLCFQFGSAGSGDGQFNAARGVAIDDDGNIYVADGINNRVQKFDPDGNFLGKFGIVGIGEGEFQEAAGIALDGTGNIYVTDAKNHRVQVFNNDFVFMDEFGTPGDGDGEFSNPVGIALDGDGNIYVADFFNNRVQVFENNGDFLLEFGSSGSGPGEFNLPWGVALDGSGNIYVTDLGNSRVQVFENDGSFLYEFGAAGSGNGQFNQLRGITVNSDGEILVADFGLNRVQVFGEGGNYLRQFGTDLPQALTANGAVHVLNDSEASVFGPGYTANIIPTSDGLVTVDVPAGVAEDEAGNPNEAAEQFSIVYDGTPPIIGAKDGIVILGGLEDPAERISEHSVGVGSIDPKDVDDGTFDNLTAQEDLIFELSQTDFDCSHIGPNVVTLTVTDEAGNSATLSAPPTIFVLDQEAPIYDEFGVDYEFNLVESGLVIDIKSLLNQDGGSIEDNCTDFESIDITIEPNTFDCEDLALHNEEGIGIDITLTDGEGNSSFFNGAVFISDIDAPTVILNNRIYLVSNKDQTVTKTPEELLNDLDNGSFDNCVIESFELLEEISEGRTSGMANGVFEFSVEDGKRTFTVSATDESENMSTIEEATVEVRIEDDFFNEPPVFFLDDLITAKNTPIVILVEFSDPDGDEVTVVEIVSSNPDIISNENIFFEQRDDGLYLIIKPNAFATGETTVSITITDGTETVVVTFTVIVSEVTGIEELISQAIQIYPNPTQGIVHVKIEDMASLLGDNPSLSYMDVTGRVLGEVQLHLTGKGYFTEIDLRGQPQGIYVLRVSGNEYSVIKRIQKL